MNIKYTNFNLVLFILEGASISSCDDTITTVESDTFKYFRTRFTTVAKNRISVEVKDIEGELPNTRFAFLLVTFTVAVCGQ